jgi:hypothetical protein
MEDTHAPTAELAPGYVQVRDTKEVLEFQGELVADSSSDDRSQTRWTELVLYRFTDGSGRYVLQTIGRSVVYHAVSGCVHGDRGVRVRLADLADRYLDEDCTEDVPEPCPDCQPLDIEAVAPDDNLEVKMEVDRYTAYVCDSVHDFLQRLRLTKGKSAGQFSMPALLLLDRARLVDPVIEDALNQVRRL